MKGDMRSLARAFTVVENELPGYEELLASIPTKNTPVIGFTGPPGAGKSTLVNEMIGLLATQGKSIGVIAVDPSSPFNFGALLGDRIRMLSHYDNPNVYIRSMASRGSLGGLSEKIIEVVELMKAYPFDFIIVETVGVGQSEVEVAGVADTTVVVMVPEAGDHIQVMKAGLMEIADIFVVNKADRPESEAFYRNLSQLVHARETNGHEIPVLKTVATSGEGLEPLLDAIRNHHASQLEKERKSWLLAAKIYRLIQRRRMRDLQPADIRKTLQEEDLNDFNLYRFMNRHYPA